MSAQITTHTKGTGSGYLTDLVAGYDVGDTTVHVDTGTGTILAGDVVTWAGDTNKYVVGTGFAGDGDGDITLSKPGLRIALDDGDALTIGNSYVPNMAFDRNAIVLSMRPPARPQKGDKADDFMTFNDPVSGLVFTVAEYAGYHLRAYEISMAWGWKAIKPEFIALLLG
jgi:hypothetical protein